MGRIQISSVRPVALSLLRIIAGFTFSAYGLQKLFGLFGGHSAKPFTLLWIAGGLEAFGGLMILIGLFTRPTAFVLSGEMAIAYFRQHAPGGFWPIINHGELAVLYSFIYLYLSTAGPGPWSVDVAVRKKD